VKYCGFDLGKKSSVFCIIDESRKVLRRGKVRNRSGELAKAFALDGPMRFALEASGKSFWVAEELEKLGHKVFVVDPGKTKAIAAARIKHDRLDAKILATLCQADLLFSIDRPTKDERIRRVPFVARDGLVRSRTRLLNLVRSLLDGEGYELRACQPTRLSHHAREVLKSAPLELAFALEPILHAIDELNASIEQCDVTLVEDNKNDATIALLQTVPGVGQLTAACFVHTMRRPERFSSRRKVGCYLGLVPTLYQSGKSSKRGHITKQGNRSMRWLLTQAASVMLHCSKQDNYLKRWALRVAERGGRKKAIVALARRLAEVLWVMWRTGRPFEPRIQPA